MIEFNLHTLKRWLQEVGVYSFDSHAQEVASLQCVVAIVVVGGVLKHQASLPIVLISLHVWADVFGLLDLLALVEPPQGGQWLPADGEDHTCVVPSLGFLELYDDRRNYRKELKVQDTFQYNS